MRRSPDGAIEGLATREKGEKGKRGQRGKGVRNLFRERLDDADGRR
jgi:hypothetical protein